MTTQQELKERYVLLYDFMATSKKTEYMVAFGHVMNEMMDWMIANKPDAAEELINKLESIRWNNYLTPKEADAIVVRMIPKAPWGKDTWERAMESLDIALEEYPYYNKCSLWVEMNKMYSDHAETLAKVFGKALQDISTDTMVKAMHSMAIDTLKDKDKVYSIRSYFGL
jgi:hypothetical protein